MRNTSSLLGDVERGRPSSSLDTIVPPINQENPQHSSISTSYECIILPRRAILSQANSLAHPRFKYKP